MENSNKFIDEKGKDWFVSHDEEFLGPFTEEELFTEISKNKISLVDYGWTPSFKQWKRLMDVESFQSLLPKKPSNKLIEEIKANRKPSIKRGKRRSSVKSSDCIWFLYYNQTQFGPFTKKEIEHLVEIGKIHIGVYCWKDGMANWSPLKAIADFEGLEEIQTETETRLSTKIKLEMRSQPRKPMVARILVANAEQVIVGVCRDISMGGMQILTDQIPGKVGTQIKINVNPTDPRIVPFVTEGVIVRIMEDGRGFSFRFDRLDDSAKDSIRNYIKNIS